MGNIIVIIILLVIFSLAGYKLYWNKKHNVKCSGCPSAKGGECACEHENK